MEQNTATMFVKRDKICQILNLKQKRSEIEVCEMFVNLWERTHTINRTARSEYGIIITIERLNSNSVYLRGALKGRGQRHLFPGLFDW